jgi:hypothetical protein
MNIKALGKNQLYFFILHKFGIFIFCFYFSCSFFGSYSAPLYHVLWLEFCALKLCSQKSLYTLHCSSTHIFTLRKFWNNQQVKLSLHEFLPGLCTYLLVSSIWSSNQDLESFPWSWISLFLWTFRFAPTCVPQPSGCQKATLPAKCLLPLFNANNVETADTSLKHPSRPCSDQSYLSSYSTCGRWWGKWWPPRCSSRIRVVVRRRCVKGKTHTNADSWHEWCIGLACMSELPKLYSVCVCASLCCKRNGRWEHLKLVQQSEGIKSAWWNQPF